MPGVSIAFFFLPDKKQVHVNLSGAKDTALPRATEGTSFCQKDHFFLLVESI
jgi:hypothetical protein